MMKNYTSIPDFDSLPEIEGMPQGCAWGIFDHDGQKDHLGCLNLLTPSVVQAALKEATDGESVSLDWSLGAINTPGFSRKGLVHNIIDYADSAFNVHSFDDEIEMNTQCSSQWDSLVHYAHQASGQTYNAIPISINALIQPFGTPAPKQKLPTLEHWHQRGGLVGRGVLLDYRAWADEQGMRYDCFGDKRITVDELEKVAQWEGVEFTLGDILIIRTGYTEELGQMDATAQDKALGSHSAIGVSGTEEVAKWHWNKHFAAVASDTMAYEALPPLRADRSPGEVSELVLHPWFLALFGMNIGELWDLKALSAICKRKQRYSFLLTSSPLNVPGAVGSPPNALAIF